MSESYKIDFDHAELMIILEGLDARIDTLQEELANAKPAEKLALKESIYETRGIQNRILCIVP